MVQVDSLRTEDKFKKTEIGEIPVDWETTKFEKAVSKFISGGTPDTTNPDYWDGNIPWITGADFEDYKVGTIRRNITEEGVKNSATNIVPKGSLLIVTRTGVGKIAIAPFDIAISQDITGVILNTDKADPCFLYWHIIKDGNRLESIIQGTSINGLLRDDLASFIVVLPPLSEQKKTAEILSTVDEAIQKREEIIEKTKELKKGLMQELLTRGIGHEKFKKTKLGEVPVDWEVVKLKDILSLTYGEGLPETKREGNRYPVYGSNGIIGHHRDSLVRGPGTIIGRKGTVGSVVWSDQDFWPIDTRYYVDAGETRVNLRWLYYQLSAMKLSQPNAATGVPGLNRDLALDLSTVFPSLMEQEKIAEFLGSIDTKIEKEIVHKENVENLKRGLMEMLLTGKVRVKA